MVTTHELNNHTLRCLQNLITVPLCMFSLLKQGFDLLCNPDSCAISCLHICTYLYSLKVVRTAGHYNHLKFSDSQVVSFKVAKRGCSFCLACYCKLAYN